MDQNVSQEVMVGEEKMTQQDLQEYVRLGKLAKEVETKQNTKIDKVMSAWTRDTQEKKKYEERVAQLEREIETIRKPAVSTDEEISPDQVKLIREQLHKVGALTEDNVQKVLDKMVEERVSSMFAGRDLLSQSKKAIKDIKESYGIEADLEELLTYMDERGYRDPKDALYLKYRTDMEKIKDEKFAKERGNGMYSSTSTRAKAPRYEIDYKDKEKVKQAISETLRGSA